MGVCRHSPVLNGKQIEIIARINGVVGAISRAS